MAKRYWLFKSEPSDFSVEDLEQCPNQTSQWNGVRNYQSRNLLRDEVQGGDGVLFYYSSSDPRGVAGICEVARAGYPDHTARDKKSPYFDKKATAENPIWFMVDVKLVEKLPEIITLSTLKNTPGLENMMVTKRGARLSIQTVTADEWEIVLQLANELRR